MAVGPFKLETLLICEGAEDCAIVQRMMAENLIPPIESIAISDLGTGGGIGGLQKHLEVLGGLSDFSAIQRIGILADNDGDHQAAFDYIRNVIVTANQYVDLNGKLSVPDAPYVRSSNAAISTKIILLPDPVTAGCLETLLLRVLGNLHPDEMVCVNELVNCSGISRPAANWNQSKIDKAKVRAAIAVLNRANPALALTLLWKNKPDLIPVTHPVFSDLVAHLSAI